MQRPTIDWKNAPAGATHARLDDAKHPWRKLEANGDWYAWAAGKWTLVIRDAGAVYTARPAPVIQDWSGEGPPPVGTVCRLKFLEGQFGEGEWGTAEILYSNKQAIVWRWQGHAVFEFGANFGDVKCEPIPTPEQIAAEEREKAILEMVRVMGAARLSQPDTGIPPAEMARAYAEALHAHDYRKVEGGAA